MATDTKTKALETALFSAADSLRSKMDANEYKNYLLGIIFYKYLSDQLLYYIGDAIDGNGNQPFSDLQKLYEEEYEDEDLQDELDNSSISYKLDPQHTFTYIMSEINGTARDEQGNLKTFQLIDLDEAFKSIEGSDDRFNDLFEDVELQSSRLGNSPQQKVDTIAGVLKAIADIDLIGNNKDNLGDAYEYLIGQFASESGKKAGEFYTPQGVSELLTKLTLVGKDYSQGMTVYDPAMGSGSLLLNFKKYAGKNGLEDNKESAENDKIIYYGQEINVSTFRLARMNMILHGVDPASQDLRNGDTLDADWPPSEIAPFDAVVMNPPYSLKWSANKGFLDDPRFSKYGVLPPKSKADYAFLLHGLYHLKNSGVMAIVLPHGVLFRGAAEGKIRKKLLESGYIDAVIGLPANLFYNTSIPTTIMVLKKDKDDRDVMFIDASKEFKKNKNQNVLREEDIKKILDTYEKREDVERYAHLAKYSEIEENDFNLNIPRYVDTFVPEPPVDLNQVSKNLVETQKELDQNEKELASLMKELTSDDPEIMKGLNSIIKFFDGEDQ